MGHLAWSGNFKLDFEVDSYENLRVIAGINPYALAFIKWDCNAPIFNAHSAYLERKKISQSHLYIEYVRGLYKVLERVRK